MQTFAGRRGVLQAAIERLTRALVTAKDEMIPEFVAALQRRSRR
jgi:hypothetical protein